MGVADFDKDFEAFVTTGNGNTAIKDIYEVIPAMSEEQMKTVNTLLYYCTKWGLTDVENFIIEYCKKTKENKNLGFLSSLNMKNLLKAYTQDELIRGIRVNNNSMSGEGKQ